MTLLKICGVTNVDDAVMVSKYADYVGVIVMARVKTPRLVSNDRAREILRSITGPKPVAVVEGFDFKTAIDTVGRLGFPVIQYHGFVGEEELEIAERVSIKVAPVINYDDEHGLSRVMSLVNNDSVEYVLIDAPKAGFRVFEGGLKIPLSVVERFSGVRKVGFAGGINPGNARLIIRYRPYLIDVSSGVEKGPGLKDEGLVRELHGVVRNGG